MTSTNIYSQELQSLIESTIEANKDKPFKPTYLYIKQHSVTGLLYFGKTIKDLDYLLNGYKGSGKYWSDHLNTHGKEFVETIWYCLFHDLESIVEFALSCSYNWDIIKSTNSNNKKIWANFKYENGLNGGPRLEYKPQSQETRLKRSIALSGKPKSETHKANLSQSQKGKSKGGKGSDNYFFDMIWITNDKENIRINSKSTIPQGWRKGMLYQPVIKSIWINNGISDKKIKETSSIPEGWNRGRTTPKRFSNR